LNEAEAHYYRQALAEIDTPEWVYQHNRPASEAPLQEAMQRCPGGLLKCGVILDAPRSRLKQVWITGDFFVKPRRLVADLEASLRNTPLAELEQRVEAFFAGYETELLMLGAEDFIGVIRAAIEASKGADA
jgi:lipoate-protein ligase A